MKKMTSRDAALDFVENAFDAAFELAAIFRSGDQRPEREREHALAAQRGRNVAARRCAAPSPSTIAVLPTPGSPTSTGLFLLRRARIETTRSISSSRPITGSSLPARARSVRSREKLPSVGVPAKAFASVRRAAIRPRSFPSPCTVSARSMQPAIRPAAARAAPRNGSAPVDRPLAARRPRRDAVGRRRSAPGGRRSFRSMVHRTDVILKRPIGVSERPNQSS